jgi:hypothetical protein
MMKAFHTFVKHITICGNFVLFNTNFIVLFFNNEEIVPFFYFRLSHRFYDIVFHSSEP